MSETKVFSIPDTNNSLGEAAMLMNGGMGNNMWNNPIWAIVFLAALGRNGGFFGGNGYDGNAQLSQIQATLNTNQGNTLLMDAIKGNGCAINQLATRLNCDVNAINGAINSVQAGICSVGNQVGMTREGVINAVNSGNAMIANTLQQCCCDVKTEVLKMGYENQINNMQQSQLIQNGFSQVGYATAEQTCAIKQAGNDNANRIIAKLDQIEDSRKDREIASLTAALTAATSRAERAAELAPINKALADIQCKQPNVVTVPYQPFVTVPNCVAWQAGFNGFNNNGSIWS